MRRTLMALVILVSLLSAGLPAQGKPLPQTREAAREAIHDILEDADGDAAKALRVGHRLLKELRAEIHGLGVLQNARLDIRASFAQPVIRDAEDFLALSWVATKGGQWKGVYWLETSAGTYQPRSLVTDNEGVILFVDSGLTQLPEEIDMTYHFLGVDGKHTRHHIGVSKILDFIPLEDHADFGAVAVSHVGHEPEAIFLTPWNILGESATMGFTFYAGETVLDEVTMVACADYETEITEYGCRLLYIARLPADLTSVVLWHVDESGDRLVDQALDRATIDAGYQFPA